jgi:hypothetical protein
VTGVQTCALPIYLFPDDIRIEETFSYLVRMFRMKNFVLPLDPKPTGSKIFMEKKKREDK